MSPRDVPSVDPSTLGRKTLYELASLKYCYIKAASSLLSPLTFAECGDGEPDELLRVRVDGHEREALRYVLAAVVVEPGHPVARLAEVDGHVERLEG